MIRGISSRALALALLLLTLTGQGCGTSSPHQGPIEPRELGNLSGLNNAIEVGSFATLDVTKLHDHKRVTATVSSQSFGVSYETREANSRLVFTSDTSAIRIRAVNDTLQNALLNSPGGFHSVGLVIDDVPYAAGFQLGTTVGQLVVSDLSGWASGTHTFELVEGQRYILTSKRGTPVQDYAISPGASFSIVNPSAPTRRIVVTGDSISSGQVISVAGHAAPYDAWPMVMRKNAAASVSGTWAGARVINDSIAGWQLDQIANDATTIAALTAQCDGTVANLWVIMLGVNDYLQSKAGATFTNDINTLLDLFHTAVPGASVLVITPLDEVVETANGAGLTLGDYRTRLTTSCNARSTYCTILSGVGIINSGTDTVSDGIHPNSAGMAKIEPAVRAAIGY